MCQPRSGKPGNLAKRPAGSLPASPRQARQPGKEAPRKFASLAPASPASWQRGPPQVCQPRAGKPGSLPASPRQARQAGKEAPRKFASLAPGFAGNTLFASLPALLGTRALANCPGSCLPVCQLCRARERWQTFPAPVCQFVGGTRALANCRGLPLPVCRLCRATFETR